MYLKIEHNSHEKQSRKVLLHEPCTFFSSGMYLFTKLIKERDVRVIKL